MCDESCYYGSDVIENKNGHACIAAECVDGEHRLDVATGELIDADFIL